jgi:type I restriction enzyme M protein
LSNNKAAHRKGKVQLIDAGQLYRKLRKNLGNKNCEFAPEHIHEILRVYVGMETVEIGEIGEIKESVEISEIIGV